MGAIVRLSRRHRRGLAFGAVRALAGIARLLPRRGALGLFGGAGRLFFELGLDRHGRERALENLRRVFGDTMDERDIRRLCGRAYSMLARSAADALRLGGLTREAAERLVEARGIERLEAAYREGRGVICVTGHIGNWELLGAYCSLQGYPVSVVATSLRDPRFDEMIVGIRESVGIDNIPRGASPRRLVSALRRGRILGILMDQNTAVAGIPADFLGTEAHTPVGPASLALATGAVVLPMAIYWIDGARYVVEVGERVPVERTGDRDRDLREVTERLNRELSRFILEHPDQWVWMHDRWRRRADEAI